MAQLNSRLEYALHLAALIDDGFSLDFDIKKGGLESMKLMEEAGLLPRTYTQRSATGGYHKTFKCAPALAKTIKNNAGKISGFPGTDVRASRKGYIVGAGSTTADGNYTIADDAPIADAPQKLLEILPKEEPPRGNKFEPPAEDADSAQEIARTIDYLERLAPEAIEGQHGDDTTIAVCMRILDQHLSDENAFELLCEWNSEKAIPPWDEDDLLKKFKSARKSRKNAVGVKSAEVELEAVDVPNPTPPPNAWDDPSNVWKVEGLPPDMLDGNAPSIAVKFGTDRARSYGVNADAVIAATIGVVGSLIPATNTLQMLQNRSTWEVLPIFWTGLVGDLGSAKTAAAKAPLDFPKVIDKKWAAEFAAELREYERAELAYTARGSKKKENAGSDTNEEELLPPQKPKLRSKIANDATTEALASRLAETPEVAPIVLHTDELSGWLANQDAYRNKVGKDRAAFLQAKEGGSYRIDRQGRGSSVVPNWAISIMGGIQDDLLAKLAPDLAIDGLLQRFALVALNQIGPGEDNPEDPSIEAAIPRVALALSSLPETTYRFDTVAAGELWAIKAFKAREMLRPDIPSGLKTWLAKSDAEFGRYALAFHLIDWACVADAIELPAEPLISSRTAIQARRYVEEFLYSHARYIHSTVLNGRGNDNEIRWVAAFILTYQGGLEKVTARIIGKNYRPLGNNRKLLFAVMARLELEGWVRTVDPVQGHWKVNPSVHDGRFDDIKRVETDRRAAVRQKILTDGGRRRNSEETA